MKKTAYCVAAFYLAASVQFVGCIAFAASRYGPPTYDLVTTTISDVQAIKCGIFEGAQVCSPMHFVANLSVALLGWLMIAGSFLFRPLLPRGRRRDVAVALLVVAGLAAFANAFTPEDVTFTGDLVTAIIAFLGANFGLIQIGRTVSTEPRWRGYCIFSEILGTFGIAAFILDGFGLGTLIGNGTIEWLIVAPILVWAPATGLRLILGRYQSNPST